MRGKSSTPRYCDVCGRRGKTSQILGWTLCPRHRVQMTYEDKRFGRRRVTYWRGLEIILNAIGCTPREYGAYLLATSGARTPREYWQRHDERKQWRRKK